MSKRNPKTNLLDHSDAKVTLLGKYLSIYLNVLSRSPINKIYLFDLFCGEGIYEDGGKGSPIVILECIKNHFYANEKKCPDIDILFNDVGQSEIDPNKTKVERVEMLANKIFRPLNVNVHFRKIDYNDLVLKVIERTNSLKANERALIFIDPWGYKEINPQHIKNLIQNKKTEVLLFLPIYFMSRFVEKSRDEEYKGGRAVRNFINNLFGSIHNLDRINSQKDFIYKIQQQFKELLGTQYVDTFKIEREKNNWFCLFFFTNNKKGFHKMIESKWAIDKKQGNEHKSYDNTILNLFDEIEITNFDQKVMDYLKSQNINNIDLTDFSYENNFLPTHTKSILDKWKEKIELISLDDKPARSYYLGNYDRKVLIKINE